MDTPLPIFDRHDLSTWRWWYQLTWETCLPVIGGDPSRRASTARQTWTRMVPAAKPWDLVTFQKIASPEKGSRSLTFDPESPSFRWAWTWGDRWFELLWYHPASSQDFEMLYFDRAASPPLDSWVRRHPDPAVLHPSPSRSFFAYCSSSNHIQGPVIRWGDAPTTSPPAGSLKERPLRAFVWMPYDHDVFDLAWSWSGEGHQIHWMRLFQSAPHEDPREFEQWDIQRTLQDAGLSVTDRETLIRWILTSGRKGTE